MHLELDEEVVVFANHMRSHSVARPWICGPESDSVHRHSVHEDFELVPPTFAREALQYGVRIRSPLLPQLGLTFERVSPREGIDRNSVSDRNNLTRAHGSLLQKVHTWELPGQFFL